MDKSKYISTFEYEERDYNFYDINKLSRDGYDIKKLPYSIKILVENILRNCGDGIVIEQDLLTSLAGKRPIPAL